MPVVVDSNHGRSRRALRAGCLLLAAALALPACSRQILVPTLHPSTSVPPARGPLPILKVHMRSGELYTLTAWSVDAEGTRVSGTGERYSRERRKEGSGPYAIPVADVALFETNRPEKVGSGATLALAIMTTITGTLAGICAADPKSCFGSCPTFYVEGGSEDRPVAEGFSASIARVLEARDVDALFGVDAGRRLVLTMRNEAFETHAVRRVGLLAFPRPPGGGRVLAGVDDRFHEALAFVEPTSCEGEGGDCREAVVSPGGAERASFADAEDLATRETVQVEFPPAEGAVGLVLGARQTLLSTHLFYQTMAYFGSQAGEFLASVERGGPGLAERALGMARHLGGIEAEVSEGGGEWRPIGRFDETGPIAGDIKVLPFEAGGGPLRVRLRQAKGHWRLDYVALASLGAIAAPERIEPRSVERGGQPVPRALGLLQRGDGHLVTSPGQDYRIAFDLPHAPHGLELFLESEGYYYEWMREEWLAEEDPTMAALVVSDPAEALRRMAGPFKRREAGMERAFWASRFRP